MVRQMQKPLKQNYLQGPDGPRLTSSTQPVGDAINQLRWEFCTYLPPGR